MAAKVKDYPGTGCPICWTRKNLNECIGAQYLTVQELLHMVSHWRTEIKTTGFGGDALFKAMKSLLDSGFAYFEGFSSWRQAHEQAEMFNFKAEDYSVENIDAYQERVVAEAARFAELTAALSAFETLYKQLETARSLALGKDEAAAPEAGHFAEISGALAIARAEFATTMEARRRYFEKIEVYAKQRADKVKPAVAAPAPAPAKTACGCASK